MNIELPFLTTSELRELLPYSTDSESEELLTLLSDVPTPVWTPLQGPQADAYYSEADELFYGGAAGGGKSDLLLGLASTRHYSSVIFRREFPRLRALVERSRELFGAGKDSIARAKDNYNESLHIWRLGDGRMVEFAAIQYEHDKENQRGRPRDLYCWDEVTEFTEGQVRFVNAWNRSTRQGQRCRIVATGNPPTSAEGEWVIRYWAPWLDGQYANPAKPGELRWFARVDNRDVEVETSAEFVHKGETIKPRSRTFIPARLSDNPILAATGYGAVLQGLPEPLRSQMLFGDFSIGVQDNPWQVIPTEWVRKAQARWKSDGAGNQRLGSIGVDVARGGDDKTVLAIRYGDWFQLEKHAGRETPNGDTVLALIRKALLPNPQALVNIDVIGIGAAVFDLARQAGLPSLMGVNFAERAPAGATDKAGILHFANMRAFAFWSLRELLDPATSRVALPPDQELLSDLTAARWQITATGIQIEAKDKIRERIGRSPDCGDALALSILMPLGGMPATPQRLRA